MGYSDIDVGINIAVIIIIIKFINNNNEINSIIKKTNKKIQIKSTKQYNTHQLIIILSNNAHTTRPMPFVVVVQYYDKTDSK